MKADPLIDAMKAVRRGGLIVMPTDTVYGIAGRPDVPSAIARVFKAKGRPTALGLPVLVASLEEARSVARFDGAAERLAGELWPGPVTLVLPRTDTSHHWKLGGDPDSIGVRIPRHPLALALLSATGPLAVTSANRSGQPPARNCDELLEVFGDAVDVYLCEDTPSTGIASTVVDLAGGTARILREGDITSESIVRLLANEEPLLDSRLSNDHVMTSILIVCTGNVCRSPIAEGLLRKALGERFGSAAPLVESAGTAAWVRSSAVRESVMTAGELGVDISGHLGRQLEYEMIREADLVIGMAADHRELVRVSEPSAAGRTFTLKELVRLLEGLPAPNAPGDERQLLERVAAAEELRQSGARPSLDESVADPLGQPVETFRATGWEIDDLVRRLIRGVYGPEDASHRSTGPADASTGTARDGGVHE